MQRAILCSLVCASTRRPTPTFAQQVWGFAGPEAGQFQARAGVCPLDDADTGNFFTLSCDKNGPLQWGILAAGEGMPDRISTRHPFLPRIGVWQGWRGRVSEALCLYERTDG